MADNQSPFPTCILKVNLSSCAKCGMKVKKKLQKINGVYSINIDTKKGLVCVCGLVDPPLLQNTLRNIGKNVELLAYEKDPIKAKKILDQFINTKQNVKDGTNKNRNGCNKDHESVPSKDEVLKEKSDGNQVFQGPDGRFLRPPQYLPGNGIMTNNPGGFDWYDPRVYGYTFRGPPFPPGFGRPYTAMRPYGYFGRPPPPQPLLPQSLPPISPPPPPVPLSNVYAVFSGQTDPPNGNSIYHSFSDENVKACNVM